MDRLWHPRLHGSFAYALFLGVGWQWVLAADDFTSSRHNSFMAGMMLIAFYNYFFVGRDCFKIAYVWEMDCKEKERFVEMKIVRRLRQLLPWLPFVIYIVYSELRYGS